MSTPAQFPFISRGTGGPVPDLAPIVPIRLSRGGVNLDVAGIVDSGASVSVLPYSVGARFGIDWDSLSVPCIIGGSVGGMPGKMLVLDGTIHPFPPVPLVFAWVRDDRPPILLGQTNFFMEFDAFLFRRQGFFQIQPATP
jgi:hypothetical protein